MCEGSLIRYRRGHEKDDWLLFMNPVDTVSRKDVKVKLSRDCGANWEVIYEAPYIKGGYSDMVELSDGSVAVLYEAGDDTARDCIAFDILPKKIIR